MTHSFIHLRFHSAYSLLEGALQIGDVIKLASEMEMPALGIADTNNLFGALEFSQKAIKAGIQPIVAVELTIDFSQEAIIIDPGTKLDRTALPTLVLIAKDETGYARMMQLSSDLFANSRDGDAQISFQEILKQPEGLICLSGGSKGPIDRLIHNGDAVSALKIAENLSDCFKDHFYIEIQRHQLNEQRLIEPKLIDIANKLSLPIVATVEPYFKEKGDYDAHDALLAIAAGTRISDQERRSLTAEHYFKTASEVASLFSDLPQALNSTIEIAKRCSFAPSEHSPILPRYDLKLNDLEAEANELDEQAREGLKKRLEAHGLAPEHTLQMYEERLEYELSIIRRMQFPGYFLIVSDFIKWAKEQDIPVGPGRGSGAGSLVAWVLLITDVDPLRYGLLFERFLNPERVSMPDFDIDFCQDRRDEVISYVRDKYGADQVAQIITFGTLQARAVLRDVGRVLDMPYGQVDRITKLVPSNPANPVSLKQALEEEPKLREEQENEQIVGTLFDIALRLEGLYRHASTHAAGIVIGDRPLTQLVPLYTDPRSDMPVTQFNMKLAEASGLVKFDFLGLKTLTVIDQAIKLLTQRDIHINIEQIPVDDAPTYEMLAGAQAVGIFQLESSGMRSALSEMKPDRIEDIVALVALYRPGPMANIPVYCARKHGKEEAEYLHPKMAPILEETFGVIVYQEQVMEIARRLAGYTLGDADLLRRAMGKKIRAEMDKQQEIFIKGAVEREIPKKKAVEIFQLMAKFADYGFNKSHAAAYAIIAYQTAYLKTHYPVEFLAASMTLDMGNTDKLKIFVEDAKRMEIDVEIPSINNSMTQFSVKDGKIFYALAAVKGVGEGAIDHIIEVRGDKPFSSIDDFAKRINPTHLNKRVIENLAVSGAFDEFDKNRAKIYKNASAILAFAQSEYQNRLSGQINIFGEKEQSNGLPLLECDSWLTAEKLEWENKALGFFLSGHPLQDYEEQIKAKNILQYAQFVKRLKLGHNLGKIAATVTYLQERRNKKGKKMGFVGLSDQSGNYEAIIFSDQLASYRELLTPGANLLVTISGRMNGDEASLKLETAASLDQKINDVKTNLDIIISSIDPIENLKKHLSAKGKGEVKITVQYPNDRHEVDIMLPGKYKTTADVIAVIKTIEGVVDVETNAG